MTDMDHKERIRQMAVEAGMVHNRRIDEFSTPLTDGVHLDELLKFAKAVARECADACKARNMGDGSREDQEAMRCHDAIRACFGLEG